MHAAAVGFDNVEDDVRRRFHEIQARLYEENEKHAKPEPTNKDKQVDSGWGAE